MEVQRAPTGVKGITKIIYESGQVRYRLVVDAGPDPRTGNRRQLTYTHRTLKQAKAKRNETLAERDKGTLVVADKNLTIEQACEKWLAGKRKLAPDSRRTYREELKQVTRALGALPVQSLTKEHVEQLVDAMQDGTARRIGRRGQPLSPASIKMVVGRLAQVLDTQVKQGNLARNVARLVELPELPKRADHKAWTVEETRRFLQHVQGDRLYACWLLSLHGLRRHEVLGLTWDAVDLDAGTLTIRQSKTRAGERGLPLTPVLVPALKAHRRQLGKERLAAGEAYVVGDVLAVDELGQPIRAEWYSDEFKRQAKAAGVRQITLHSARHGAATLMRSLGIDPWTVAAWLGHADPTLTLGVYTDKPRLDALREAGEAFSALLDPDVREL